MLKTKSELRDARQKLKELDADIDGNEKVKVAEKEVSELEETLDRIETDYKDKRNDERIDQKLLSKANQDFLAKK